MREISARDHSDLHPQTEAQADYIASINTNMLTFGLGPAGTGKTFVACSIAAAMLMEREIDRIIITRPLVEAGERLGFLPGEMIEKTGPYMTPVLHVLNKRLGRGAVEMFLKSERIEVLPLAFMRGRSLENAFIILDEAQNTTPVQMKMFLTRMEESTRIVVDGDLTQMDIDGPSGLADALDRIGRLNQVGVVRFTHDDIVRSGFVQDVVAAYQKPHAAP